MNAVEERPMLVLMRAPRGKDREAKPMQFIVLHTRPPGPLEHPRDVYARIDRELGALLDGVDISEPALDGDDPEEPAGH